MFEIIILLLHYVFLNNHLHTEIHITLLKIFLLFVPITIRALQ